MFAGKVEKIINNYTNNFFSTVTEMEIGQGNKKE